MTFNVLKKPDVFYIGKQDEGKAETIDIDYSAWIERYGDGVITATFQGAEDAAPYDIVLTTANGIATWTVTKANTAAAGVGKLQLNYIVNDVEAKSLIWTVRVYPSMRASGEAPDGYQDWLTALQGLSAETQQNAQNAANSATEAEGYADQAKASADSITGLTVEAETLPAGSSATASFDADTDKLSLGIPRGDKGEKGDTGQDGITPDLTIGTTETLPAGSSATATITGTKENPVLNLGIPQGTQGIQGERGGKGDTGATPDISIGTVETLNPDESATATITGTAEDPVLNLGIPKGDTGSAGADGFSPSASVTKQDGNIVIIVTDKDGTTSETLEVDDALDETSENPVQNTAIVEAMRSMLPVDTASGAIASFPDGADDVPMLSLKAHIEPVQDLHGYDSPWPAGGGNNLWGDIVMANDMARTVNASVDTTNKTVSIATGSSSSEVNMTEGIVFKENTQYTFIFDGTVASYGNLMFVYTDGTNDRGLNRYCTVGANVSAPGKTVAGLYKRSYSGTTIIYYEKAGLFEGALTASQFSPYSNECPISGHTGVTVKKRGKNLLTAQSVTKNGSTYLVGASSTNEYPFFLKAGTYTMSNSGTAAYCYWRLQGTNLNNIIHNAVVKYGTFTITEDGYYRFWFYSTDANASFTELQLELGSTATDYETYQGETITQEFVDEQGNQLTVYGGESEIVGGKLTSRMAMVTLPTSTSRWYSGYGGYYYQDSAIKGTDANRGEAKCNMFSTVASRSERGMYVGNATIYFTLVQDTYPTLSDWMTFINDTNVQCVLPLAEPIEYTLTPQEVRTFLGQNNIWSDTGDTEVMYRADIQKYIDKKMGGDA